MKIKKIKTAQLYGSQEEAKLMRGIVQKFYEIAKATNELVNECQQSIGNVQGDVYASNILQHVGEKVEEGQTFWNQKIATIWTKAAPNPDKEAENVIKDLTTKGFDAASLTALTPEQQQIILKSPKFTFQFIKGAADAGTFASIPTSMHADIVVSLSSDSNASLEYLQWHGFNILAVPDAINDAVAKDLTNCMKVANAVGGDPSKMTPEMIKTIAKDPAQSYKFASLPFISFSKGKLPPDILNALDSLVPGNPVFTFWDRDKKP